MKQASEGAIEDRMAYFHSGFFDIAGQQVYLSRTGWTGELGFEEQHTRDPQLQGLPSPKWHLEIK